tara:strand:+ start:2009 stop:2422 length:414 start_codon:yes stop_codon:yes gene_type:complete
MCLRNIAKIYKLINEDNLFYIGSTTYDLEERLKKHKYVKNNYLTSKKLFENNKNVIIELLEEFNFESKKEILEKEKYYIEMYINDNNCVNKNLPYITNINFKNNNTEYKKEYYKYWYQKNRERRLEYYKQYRQNRRN